MSVPPSEPAKAKAAESLDVPDTDDEFILDRPAFTIIAVGGRPVPASGTGHMSPPEGGEGGFREDPGMRPPPGDRLEAIASWLPPIGQAGHVIIPAALHPNLSTQLRQGQRRVKGAQDLISLNARGRHIHGSLEPERHPQEGILGFFACSDVYDVPSQYAVTNVMNTLRTKGLVTSEGVVFKRGWHTRSGSYPKMDLFIRGHSETCRRVIADFQNAMGVPEGHLVVSCCEVKDTAGCRFVVLVEMPRKLIERAYPGLTKQPDFQRYVAALKEFRAQANQRNAIGRVTRLAPSSKDEE